MVVPVRNKRAQHIGAAQEGRIRRGGPAMVMWLPPPVPVWRPSSMNFSVARRVWCASSYRAVVVSTSDDQSDCGWMLTSITPGSGVTDRTFRRGSRGGV